MKMEAQQQNTVQQSCLRNKLRIILQKLNWLLRNINIQASILILLCSIVNLVIYLIDTYYYDKSDEIKLAILLCLLLLSIVLKLYFQIIVEILLTSLLLESYLIESKYYLSFLLIYLIVLHSIIQKIKTKGKREQIVVQFYFLLYFPLRRFLDEAKELHQIGLDIQIYLCILYFIFFLNEGVDKKLINNSPSFQNDITINGKQEKLQKFEESYLELNGSKQQINGQQNKSHKVLNDLSSHLINCLQVPMNIESKIQPGTAAGSFLSGTVLQSSQQNSNLTDYNLRSNQILIHKRKYSGLRPIERSSMQSALKNSLLQNQIKSFSKESFEADLLSQLYIGVLAIDSKKKILYQNTSIKTLFKDIQNNEIIELITKVQIMNNQSEKNIKYNRFDSNKKNTVEDENEKEDEKSIQNHSTSRRSSFGKALNIQRAFQVDEKFKKTLQKSINTQVGFDQSTQLNTTNSRNSFQQGKYLNKKKNNSLLDNLDSFAQEASSNSSDDEEIEDISTVNKILSFGIDRQKYFEELSPKKIQHNRSKENVQITSTYGKLIKNDNLSNNKILMKELNSKQCTIDTIFEILLDKNNWKEQFKKFVIHSETHLSTVDDNNFRISEPNSGINHSSNNNNNEKVSFKVEDNFVLLQVQMKTEKQQNEKPFYLKLGSYMAEKSVQKKNSFQVKSNIRMVLLVEIIPLSNILTMISESSITSFKNKMISSLSHELRTPLNCAIQMLEVLNQSDSNNNAQSQIHNNLNSPKSLLHQNNFNSNFLVSDEVKRMFIAPALNSSYLLLSMINDIIDFAQLNSGRLSLNFLQFPIRELLKEIMSLFTLPATMKNISLRLTVDPNTPHMIHSDSTRVKQVLIALMSNALKFTENGLISVNMQQLSSDLFRVSVSDTGCGISSDIKNLIFKGFSGQGLKQSQKKSFVMRSSFSASNPASKLTNCMVNTSTVMRKSQLGIQQLQKSSNMPHSCFNEEQFELNEYWASRDENNQYKSSLGVVQDSDDPSILQNRSNLNTSGAGMGLTIANQLAQGLGGNRDMGVESELNRGSTFYFYVVNHPMKSKGLKMNQRTTFDKQYTKWKTIISSEQSNALLGETNSNNIISNTFKIPSAQSLQPSIGAGKNYSQEMNQSELHPTQSSQLINGMRGQIQNQQPAVNHNEYFSQDLAPNHIDDMSFQVNNVDNGQESCVDLQYGNSQVSSFYQSNFSHLDHHNGLQFKQKYSNINANFQKEDNPNEFSELKEEDDDESMSDLDSSNVKSENNYPTDFDYTPSPKGAKIIVTQKKNVLLSPTTIPLTQDQYQGCPVIFKALENKNQNKVQSEPKEEIITSLEQKQLHTLNNIIQTVQFDRDIINLQDNYKLFLNSSFTNINMQHIQNNHVNVNQFSKHTMGSYEIHQYYSEKDFNKHTQNSLSQIASMNYFRNNVSEQSYNSIQPSSVYIQLTKKKQQQQQHHQQQNRNKRNSYTTSKSSVDKSKEKRKSVDAMHFVMNNRNSSESNLPQFHQTSQSTEQQSIQISRDMLNTPPMMPQTSPPLTIQQQLQILNSQKRCTCNNILIVDDNNFNIIALDAKLSRQYFFRVDKANSGSLAVEIVQKRLEQSDCCKTHTLIFMDIDMPNKNGHETTIDILKLFKNKFIQPPIISACTAFAQDAEKQKAKKSGMTYYITKPVDNNQLENVLSKVFLKLI